MTLPNMNTRQIRRIPQTELFTVETQAGLIPKPTICNHCGIRKCSVRDYARRTQAKHDIAMRVESCGKFIPVLGFSVLAGLDLECWNTVRIGEAWGRRLFAGKRVAIADTQAGKIVGEARVEAVTFGVLGHILEFHASRNHAVQAEIAAGKTEVQDAPARLLRILKNAYGTNIAGEDRMASVIYLKLIR